MSYITSNRTLTSSPSIIRIYSYYFVVIEKNESDYLGSTPYDTFF